MTKNRKGRLSASEIRGIALVIIGVTALLFYYRWWFVEGRLASPWLLLGFLIALIYTSIQILGNWLLYLATHHRHTTNCPPGAQDLTVDVFVTACGEEHALVQRALAAACTMRGTHNTWLLDDGHDPALAQLAKQLGAGYLTRNGRHDAKAGNINAALAQTEGDIVVIFDIDHAPKADFLERTLGCFADPTIGFVQVMLTFENQQDGWVAQAAADSSLDFYNPTAIGTDGMQSATLVGSNALIRRPALDSIGGYHPGLAEDLATSIAMHATGWHSVYVAEPLAPGYAPPDMAAWFTQQLKWARGVFELLLTAYPRNFSQLQTGQKISYAVRMTYYWIGPVVGIHLFLTLFTLLNGSEEALVTYQQYLLHLFPLTAITLIIRQLALHRWRHASLKYNLQWKAMALVFATWPIYTVAWIMAILRAPLRFRPTPKTSSGALRPAWLGPQLVTTFLLTIGLVASLWHADSREFGLVYGFALAQIAAQLMFLSQRLLEKPRHQPGARVGQLYENGMGTCAQNKQPAANPWDNEAAKATIASKIAQPAYYRPTSRESSQKHV